ncbi:TPA: hypothetical protein G8431_004458 [Salmonella enterica]|uniref:Uncharacterized protein n=1 Tax=Salmonella enterica TaxID=28901 RepID=A0A763QV96_SALER|nr:hypothetical protein [Salmonella enterica]HAG4415465.1 hypothetical protein [Salmonella enterica]HAG4424263.1 hypothetical protein [Salmonella enterica]HBM0065135.1 hypothetical protein [Salmonella enterica subsp. enterica serovar Enteritidis]
MSDKELSRINVIQSVVEKRLRRRDAAQQLALTERQTQRLMNRFRDQSLKDYFIAASHSFRAGTLHNINRRKLIFLI